ncbi:hypothetical protein HQ533_05640 [Candidatus Woesearchaeota archaeon]|nr:hypothetical protein [Candidatus Woesearchaeota archaeon]
MTLIANFLNRNIEKKAQKLTDLLTRAEQETNVYTETAIIKEYLKRANKLGLKTHSPERGQEIILDDLFSRANTTYSNQMTTKGNLPLSKIMLKVIQKIGLPNFEQEVSKWFVPKDGYRSLEVDLEEIGITKQDVLEYCFEKKKEQLVEKAYDFLEIVEKDLLEQKLTTDHFEIMDFAFTEIEQLEDDFKMYESDDSNYLACQKMLEIGFRSLENFLYKQDVTNYPDALLDYLNNKKLEQRFSNPEVLLDYLNKRKLVQKFNKRIDLSEKGELTANSTHQLLNGKALSIGLKAVDYFVNNVAPEERAKETIYRGYQNLKTAFYEEVEQVPYEEMRTILKKRFQELDEKQKQEMSEQRKILIQEKEEFYNAAMEQARNYDLTEKSFQICQETANQFYEFVMQYRTLFDDQIPFIEKQSQNIKSTFNITKGKQDGTMGNLAQA